MNKAEEVEQRLSDSNLKDIQDFLLDKLKGKSKAVKRSEVFEAIGSSLKLSKSHYCESLSKNIKSNRLPGFKIVRGPHGGISLDNVNKLTQELSSEAASSPVESVEKADVDTKKSSSPQKRSNSPFTTLKSWQWIWIKDSRYAAFMTISSIELFLTKVMLAKADESGTVVFNGVKYHVDNTKLLHRFLSDFIGATPTTSQPMIETTDVTGAPVQLITSVHENPSPHSLKEWNESQTND